MADLPISGLTAATTPLAGTELALLTQSGTSVKVTVDNLTAGRAVTTGALSVYTGADGNQATVGFSSSFYWQYGRFSDGSLRFGNNSVSEVVQFTQAGGGKFTANTIIGSTSVTPDGTLHVHTATAGTLTPSVNADDLVVENSGNGGITVAVPNASNGALYFQHPSGLQTLFISNYTANTFSILSDRVGGSLVFAAGAQVTNLTLSGASGSELATFAGDVTLSAGHITVIDANAYVSVRGTSGTSNFIHWAEDGVANRGVLGYAAGSDVLQYRTGADSTSTGTQRLTVSAGGDLTLVTGDLTLSEGKLTITDTASENALSVNSSAATVSAVVITANSLTTGDALFVRSTSGDISARQLVNIENQSSGATGLVNLRLSQNSANAFINFVGTAAANTTDPISTLTTPGALQGWVQVDINGTARWMPFYANPS